MKLFECQNCRQPLYFENTRCESCGLALGYLPGRETVSALKGSEGDWRPLAERRWKYRYCANVVHGVCNWLVRTDSPDALCLACRHNRTIPDLSVPENQPRWQKIEIAKHRLFYTLLKLRLPLASKLEDPGGGLAFDFLAVPLDPAAAEAAVVTGHASGLITIALTEADDVERERQRSQMHEPYRTLLGHFRHEVAHYYWDRLIARSPKLDEFRSIFGDERQHYSAALQRHYAQGPPPDWAEHYITAYASTHPWEDFAETWAHYFHMIDTVETASAFGLSVRPQLSKGANLAARMDFDPHDAEVERIIDAWLPLTFAVNSINRSMGLSDLYPFVLSPAVMVKLTFIHERIHAQRGRRATPQASLRAMVAGLKRSMGSAGTN
jgi:hypothetical protein